MLTDVLFSQTFVKLCYVLLMFERNSPVPIGEGEVVVGGFVAQTGKVQVCCAVLVHVEERACVTREHLGPRELVTTLKDVKRSCSRGLGGTSQADAVPLEQQPRAEGYEGVALANAADAVLVGS